MKKIFATIMTICLLVTVFCITSFSAEASTEGVAIRVSGLKENGTPVEIENADFKDFAEGWEAAVDYACSDDFMEQNDLFRIVVDFYADWNANEEGEFGKSSWTGFQYSTIYVPSDVRITINLNGHTINRGLKKWEYDGEVICINDNADVIINGGKSGDLIVEPDNNPNDVKMGTITGGYSCNGAGGIHMQDGSKLTLNNVKIVGNNVDDDDGAGIAVYDGASLIMNGGCVSNNMSYNSVYGGGVYVEDASAFFKNVTFENNQGFKRSTHGAAVYADDSTLMMEGCKVIGNGLTTVNGNEECWGAYSIISILNGSKVTMKDTKFLKNGYAQETSVSLNTVKYTSVISSKASYLTIEECDFSDNNQVYLIESEATILKAFKSDFSENKSFAFYGNCAGGFNSEFKNCKFSYNEPMLTLKDTFYFNLSNAGLSFVDCEFGDAVFNNKKAAQFVDTDAPNATGSVFAEGSLSMIFAFIAIIVSFCSIFVTIVYNKKKTVFVKEADNVEVKTEVDK